MRCLFLSVFVFVLCFSININGIFSNYLFAAEVVSSTSTPDASSTKDVEKSRVTKSNTLEWDFNSDVAKSESAESRENKNKKAKKKTIAQYREDILFNNKVKEADKVEASTEDKPKSNKVKLSYPSIYESNFNSKFSDIGKSSKIKNKDPLFFISRDEDSLVTEYSHNLCSLINNQNVRYNCLVYPIAKDADFADYMKRGVHSKNFDKTGISGDFIILREDEYIKYDKQSKKDSSIPKLDLLMFLNGEYVFMFTNKMKNIFSIEQLVANKVNDTSASSGANSIIVGVINKRAANTFSKIIAPLFPSVRFSYRNLKADAYQKDFCQPNDMDIFVYVGENFPGSVKKSMDSCVAQLNPITFSNKTLSKVTKKYPFFSIANIADYYQSSSMLNYIETYVALELAYKVKLKDEEEKAQKVQQKLNVEQDSYTQTEETSQQTLIDDTKIAPVTNSKQEVVRSIDSDPNSGKRFVKLLPEMNSETLQKEIEAEKQAEKEKEEAKKAAKYQKYADKNGYKNKKQAEQIADVYGQDSLKQNENNKQPVSTIAIPPVSKPNKKNQNYYIGNKLIVREASLPYIRGKSNQNVITSKIKDFKNITDTKSKVRRAYNMRNLSIKTFGVRYVLVASRYARKDSVLVTFDSMVKNYFLHKSYVLTPDMDKFSISDLILGTSSYSNFRYHPFLLDYPTYVLENAQQKSPEQVIALKLLNNKAVTANIPIHFGPAFPNKKELNTVFLRMRALNKQKKDLITLRIFQRDMKNIQNALSSISKGKEIDHSILKATGLDRVSVIYDDKSVIYQNSNELFNAQVGNVSGKAKGNNKTTLEVITNSDKKGKVDGKSSKQGAKSTGATSSKDKEGAKASGTTIADSSKNNATSNTAKKAGGATSSKDKEGAKASGTTKTATINTANTVATN